MRSLRFTTARPATLRMRALVGEIEALGPGAYATSELRLRIPALPTRLLRSAAGDGARELLLVLDLPQGETTLYLEYEVLQ